MKLHIAFLLCSILYHSLAQAQEPNIKIKTYKDTAYIKSLLSLEKKSNNNDSSISLLTSSLALSTELQYKIGIIQSLNLLGVRYENKGQYNKGLSCLQQALYYIHKFGYEDYLSMVYVNMSNNYRAQGQYDSALIYIYKSIEAQEQYPSVMPKATPYINLGTLLGNFRLDTLALYYLNKASIITKEQRTLAAIKINIGVIYGKMQQFNLSEQFLKAGLTIADKSNANMEKRAALGLLGLLYDEKREVDKAIYYYNQALAFEFENYGQDLALMSNLANHYYQRKNYKQANDILMRVLKRIQELPNESIVHTYFLLGQINAAWGQHKLANEYYQKHIHLYDSLEGKAMQNKINNLQLQYLTTQKENALVKRELELTQQKARIQKNVAYSWTLSVITFLLAALGTIYYHNKRKIEQQAAKQSIEIAAWKASLDGEERERQRLARELHDNIGGNLSTVKMWLDNIYSRLSIADQKNKDYNDLRSLVDITLTEVRNTAHHLMPELLLRFGLVEAVHIFCKNVQKASNIEIQFHYFGYIGKMEKAVELLIYRTIQELVQNIAKHSGAQRALVQMSLHDTLLSITIEDDGKGLMDDEWKNSKGMGLLNIKNNIEKLGGKFIVTAEKYNGTTIDIELNITQTSLITIATFA